MRKTITIIILSVISLLSAVSFIGCRDYYKTSPAGYSEKKNIIYSENPKISELNTVESTEFFVGQTFRAQKRVDFDGFVSDATAYITYPDGSRYRQNVITFDEEGIYVVRYESVNNGRKLYKDEKLTVKRRNFYFASDSYVRSSARFGKDFSEYDTGHTGLTVKLYSGDTFYYDDVIDLRKTDCGDFIRLFALPEKIGYFDLERFTIRLTDAHKEDNYIDILVSAYPQRKPPEEVPETPEERWKYNNTYLMAGANNQMPGGLEWTADGYKLVTRDITGFPAKHSMYGYAWFKNSVGKDVLNLGFDLNEKQLYYSFGSVFTIYSAIGCDVLDCNPKTTLTVLAPDGKVMADVEGISLENVSTAKEYKIKADLYGEYYISYTSVDSSNRKASYNLVVFVQDDVSPAIRGANKTITVKKNTEVKIDALMVSDEKTAEPYAVRFLTTPAGERIKLSADVQYLRFTGEGIYEIRYYAVDENGNAESLFIRIIVSGEDGK